MELQEIVPLVLLVGALGSTAAGWFTRHPAAAAVTAALLTAAALIGAVSPGAAVEGRGAITVLIVLAGALAVAGGGPVTTQVFQLVDGPQQGGGAGPVRAAGDVLRGGAWIGALERAAIFAALVTGWPEGLAIVLGLKGLGRYPELRSGQVSGTAERFIIGTFTSLLWASACAGVTFLLT